MQWDQLFSTAARATTVEEEHCAPFAAADLPDALLGRALALAGLDNGPSVSLVSKRWRAVFFSEPGLWSTFEAGTPHQTLGRNIYTTIPRELREQWCAGRYALLRRVAPLVQSFNGSTECNPLPDFLALLLPDTLTTVSLGLSDLKVLLPVLQALPGFTRLEQLGLRLEQPPKPSHPAASPAAAQSLVQLTHLRSLTLHNWPLPCQLLTQLSRLTSLELHGSLPADLRGLTSLAQLQRLTLSKNRDDLAPRIPLPPSFSRLNYLRLNERDGHTFHQPWQVAGPLHADCCVNIISDEPGGQSSSSSRQPQNAAQACSLSLRQVRLLPALQPFVDALLPAGSELADLEIEMPPAGTATATEWQCSQLAGVTRLKLHAPWHAAQALLAQAAALQELCLENCYYRGQATDAALEGLADLVHLQRLQLCCYGTLPPIGAFPPGLQELSLEGGCLYCLPPQLASATALTRLKLDCPRMELTVADVDTILLRMSRLHSLELHTREVPAALLQHLRDAAPQLQVSGEQRTETNQQEELGDNFPTGCMYCVVS